MPKSENLRVPTRSGAGPAPDHGRRHAPVEPPTDDPADLVPDTATGMISRDAMIASIVQHAQTLDLTTLGRLTEALSTSREVQRTLQRYKALQDVIAILGDDEVWDDDKLVVAHAREIERLSLLPADRRFDVAHVFADPDDGQPQVEDTIAGFERHGPLDKPVEIHGAGLGAILPVSEANAALDAVAIDDRAQDWAASELLGTGETAARLNIAPTTLANWRQAGRVVAFRKGPRNFRYPVRQFDRLGPIAGLDQVLARFATSEDAWEWLVTPNRHTASKAPLDRLQGKHLAEVVRAAAGALDFG